MKLCLVGEGAIARKHMAALQRIDGLFVSHLVGGVEEATRKFASDFGIPSRGTELSDALASSEVDAVLIASPTPLHASQAIAALEANKNVLLEIPMADSLSDSLRLCEAQRKSGRVGMVCHTRRFNPSHQWIRNKIASGELSLQHLIVETYFFRRTNTNALGEPRSWTDHLLWHHACHTVDLFQYQTGATAEQAWAQQGPQHPTLGIAMDMTVGLRSPAGALCTLALSFNNDGPFGTTFRYICDNGTYIARYDELVDGEGKTVDLSSVGPITDGFELQAREFLSAVHEGREPNASFDQCLTAMQTLDRLGRSL